MGRHVVLTVHDDGTCYCQNSGTSRAELDDIEALTELIGGHLCIDSGKEQGNTVALWMPSGRPDAQED